MTKEEFSTRILAMEKSLYHVACGILRSETDREDAVQECILKAWEKQDSLKDPSAFRSWVTRILINECYNIGRQAGRVIVLDELPEQIAPPPEDLGLKEALRALDPLYRLPVTLFYLEGYSVKEISQMLSVPEGTVKSRLHTARARLKNYLQEEDEA